MSETVEHKLIDYLQKAIRQRKNLAGNISSKLKSSIGFGLGYYITDLLKALPESNLKDKWIDGADWKELRLYSPNKFKGYGFIWWGFTEDDTSETFPDKFIASWSWLLRPKQTSYISFNFK